ncbi:hypothetical protein [Parabacteroides bouchesdurhonensis]|uniref:hypothetical protein n=1 Tax=Parabacteroides bouchesdurhonensis TaxID=1936995 RepID=UPI000E49B9E4|nr:hypothetical protein [Parabacteroides bouchesdurhonensis]RHJ92457.1 hypothetical protein DW095_07350 [Bacteroides sp. AM07-16]
MNLSTVHYQQPTSLRFKRWSRKRYAAFVSIQRAVTIGQLSANVSERFQTKQTSLHSGANLSENSCREEEVSIGNLYELVTDEIPGLSLATINCLLSIEIQSACTASDSCNNKENIHNSEEAEGSRHNTGFLPLFYAYKRTNI